MSSASSYEQFTKSRSHYLEFDVTEDGDAVIQNGLYKGMLLSDIYVVKPSYIEWIITNKKIHISLKTIAKSIKKVVDRCSDSIAKEIALNG